jgi:hypothetical protein
MLLLRSFCWRCEKQCERARFNGHGSGRAA